MYITRRDLFKMAGVAALSAVVGSFGHKATAASSIKISQAPVIGCKMLPAQVTKDRRLKFISQKILTRNI